MNHTFTPLPKWHTFNLLPYLTDMESTFTSLVIKCLSFNPLNWLAKDTCTSVHRYHYITSRPRQHTISQSYLIDLGNTHSSHNHTYNTPSSDYPDKTYLLYCLIYLRRNTLFQVTTQVTHLQLTTIFQVFYILDHNVCGMEHSKYKKYILKYIYICNTYNIT